MRYNIIGDINGADSWKELWRDDCVNIFMGNYFGHLRERSYAQAASNFREIIRMKILHPETVLLLGDNDLAHWVFSEGYEKEATDQYLYKEAGRVRGSFKEWNDLFQTAYAIGDHILITHAGITREWYSVHFEDGIIPRASGMARRLNARWSAGDYEVFDYEHNCAVFGEYYRPFGPMWAEADFLRRHNAYSSEEDRWEHDVVQVVGHTAVGDITLDHINTEKVVLVNVLECSKQSLIFDCATAQWEIQTLQ